MASLTKTSKSDTPKLIALSITILIIAILLTFQITSFVNPQADPSASAATPEAAASVDGAGGATEGGEIVIPNDVLGPNIDPFRQVLVKRAEPLTSPPPVTQEPSRPDRMGGVIELPKPTQGDPTGPLKIEPTAEILAKPRLSGVLLGNRPVAVLEIGDKSFVVGVGEKLPGGFRVLSIYETSVVVSSGTKRLTLTLDEPKT